MAVLMIKIICLFCLLVLSLVFGNLPYFVLKRSTHSNTLRRERIIKYFNCFAGGVFLGALFLELMIEGAEEFENYKAEVGYKSDFPFFNVIVIVGFFLTSSVEYFAHSVLAHRHQSLPRSEASCEKAETQSLHNGAKKDYGSTEGQKSVSVMSPPEHLHNDRATCEESSNCEDHEGDAQVKVVYEKNTVVLDATFNTFRLRSLLLLLALSFHSLFDGLALGLQDTESEVWQLFAAVSLHRCIVAFCLGLELFGNSTDPKVAALWMGVFCLISPIGTSIGISLTSSDIDLLAKLLSSSILQGLACGAFFYVTFMEILNSSWKNGTQRSFLDVFFAFFGFTVMTIAKVIK